MLVQAEVYSPPTLATSYPLNSKDKTNRLSLCEISKNISRGLENEDAIFVSTSLLNQPNQDDWLRISASFPFLNIPSFPDVKIISWNVAGWQNKAKDSELIRYLKDDAVLSDFIILILQQSETAVLQS